MADLAAHKNLANAKAIAGLDEFLPYFNSSEAFESVGLCMAFTIS